MQTVVIIIHLMIVLALTGLVLLQKSEGGGLGMGGGGGGGGGGFLSTRGTANVLTRATAILAAIFFATSLLLSILAGIDRRPRSIVAPGTPGSTQPVGPAAPRTTAPAPTPAPTTAPAPAGGPSAPPSK